MASRVSVVAFVGASFVLVYGTWSFYKGLWPVWKARPARATLCKSA